MCYGLQPPFSSPNDLIPERAHPPQNGNASVVEGLRDRLANTEARLQRARAREADLTRRLEEMKRFVSVMEILESFLKRKFLEQQERLFSPVAIKQNV